MKKYISVIFTAVMVFSMLAVISPLSVFAEGETGFNTPDDAFEGNYTEFEGKDGSVTRVFDNGSVSTKYKDGTTSAVDYNGNQYSEDKEGNASVRTTDGYIATEYSDGRKSVTEPDGKTTTMNMDGSFSESYRLGITLDYNADGGLTGIGITGSDERIETDENGYYKSGTIGGPNGSKLTITDDGMQFVNTEGTVYDHTDIGDKKTTTIKWKDGSHCEAETTVTWNGGEKTENTNFTMTDSNGERWDSNVNKTFDANGDPKYVNNNVVQWTGADGSKLWMDNNSKAMNFSDKDGTVMVIDSNGNLTEYKDSDNTWNVTYDEDGNVTSADITYPDGAKMIKNANGTTTFTLPDGTKYESDGDGNVFKNGIQIKNAGQWVEQSPGESTQDESTPDEGDSAETEQENQPETPSTAKTGLSTERIAGTYSVTSTNTWEDFDNSEYSGTETDTIIIQIKANSETSLTMSAEDVSITANDYDPTTGTCTFVSQGVATYFTFTESGGSVTLRYTYDEVLEGGRTYGHATGTKQ